MGLGWTESARALLRSQAAYLDTVSTTCGSGWIERVLVMGLGWTESVRVLLRSQAAYLDTVSTTCGSGWIEEGPCDGLRLDRVSTSFAQESGCVLGHSQYHLR